MKQHAYEETSSMTVSWSKYACARCFEGRISKQLHLKSNGRSEKSRCVRYYVGTFAFACVVASQIVVMLAVLKYGCLLATTRNADL